MRTYKYIDDPEPKEFPETTEDKIIRKGKLIFDIILTVAAVLLIVGFIAGVIIRNT